MKNKLFLYIILALALVFSASAIGNVNIIESTASVSGNPGAINSTEYITVQNTGGSDLNNIAVSSTDLASGSETIASTAIEFVPASVNLGPGNSTEVAIILTIPSNQKAGTYVGSMSAEHNASHKDYASLVATVNSVPGYTASADSPTIAKGLSGQITVTVTNTGNTDISGLSYSVSNPFTSGAETLSISSSAAGTRSVPYGSDNTLTISFNPPSNQVSGTYAGSVDLSHSGIDITVPLTVTVRDPLYSVSLGDVVYPESRRDTNVTKNVTITNNGDYALTGITLTDSDTETWISGAVPPALAAGSSFTVILTSTVPEDADSGSDKVGTLDFKSNQLNKSVDIMTNARSMLEFDSVKVSIDDGSWDSLNDGGTADDEARPGDTFAVKVKLENLYDDNDDDIDMENIEINAVFHNAGEGGDDIEGDIEFDDVKAGDRSDEEEIDFDDDVIDWEADAGKLLVELFAEAEDDNNAMHEAYFSFYIDVERENKAEFIFTRLDAPAEVACGRSFTLYVDGRSIGEKSDNEVVMKLDSNALGLNIREEFEMGAYDDEECDALDRDEDDCIEFTYRTTVDVSESLASGTYTIIGKMYRDDGNKQTDEETLDVRVDCSEPSSSSTSGTSGTSGTSSSTSGGTTATTTPTTTTPTTPTTQPGATTSTVEVFYGAGEATPSPKGVVATMPTMITDTTREAGFTESVGYLALLSILSILAIAAIIVLLIYAFTKPAE
jgi:uncharacterized membrane protein